MTPKASDQKKQKILDAVGFLLARQGYAGATISQVAAQAGVSRGLLHYYFKNKEDMLAQVTRANVENTARLVRDLFDQCGAGDDLAGLLTSSFKHLLKDNPDYYNVFFESWALARTSGRINLELDTLFKEIKLAMQQGLADAAARGVISPAIPPAGLAGVLVGLFDGLGLQLMSEPRLGDDEDFWRAAQAGVGALLG